MKGKVEITIQVEKEGFVIKNIESVSQKNWLGLENKEIKNE